MYWHWTLESGGKKAFKQYLTRMVCPKKLFFVRQFYTLYHYQFSNLRPLLSITYNQGFQKSKKFWYRTLGSGVKKTFKRYVTRMDNIQGVPLFLPPPRMEKKTESRTCHPHKMAESRTLLSLGVASGGLCHFLGLAGSGLCFFLHSGT